MFFGTDDLLVEHIQARFPLGIYSNINSLKDVFLDTSPRKSLQDVCHQYQSLFFEDVISLEKLFTHSLNDVKALIYAFQSAIQYNYGDENRCAAFIIHNKVILKILIMKNMIDMIVKDDIPDEILVSRVISAFFPDLHSEELKKHICSVMDTITCSGTVWDTIIMLFAGNTSSIDKGLESNIIFQDPSKSNAIESFCGYVKKHAFFHCIPSCNIKSSDAQSHVGHMFPCKALSTLYKEILKNAYNHIISMTTNDNIGSILDSMEKALRCSFQSEILLGMSDWKKIYNEYAQWENKNFEKDSFTSVTLQDTNFQENARVRARYEKSVRSTDVSVSIWIEYIMWEYSAAKVLISTLHQKDLLTWIIPFIEIRPFILCNRAIVDSRRFILAQSLLCASMSISKAENTSKENMMQEKFNCSWTLCEPALQNLYLRRNVSPKSFKKTFVSRLEQDLPFECKFISELPLWIQFIALLRIVIKNHSSKHLEKFRLVVTFFILNTTFCVFHTLQHCRLSGSIWIEFSAFLYEYKRFFNKVAVENGEKLSNEQKKLRAQQQEMIEHFIHANKEEEFYQFGPVSSITMKAFELIQKKELIPNCEPLSFGIIHTLLYTLTVLEMDCKIDTNESLTFFHVSELIKTTVLRFYEDVSTSLSMMGNTQISFQNNFRDEVHESLKVAFAIDHFCVTLSQKLSEKQSSHYTSQQSQSIVNRMSELFDFTFGEYDKISCFEIYESQAAAYSSSIDFDKEQKLLRTNCVHKIQKFIRIFCKNDDESYAKNLKSSFMSVKRAVGERISQQILLCIINLEQKMLQDQCFISLDTYKIDVENFASENIFNVFHQMFEKSIEIFDDTRVMMQSNNLDSWIYFLGGFSVRFKNTSQEPGVPFIYMCNIPIGSDLASIKTWILPFKSFSTPKIKRQKNQLIVLLEMPTIEEAIRCSENKNRSTWNDAGKLRKISVQNVKTSQELRNLTKIFRKGNRKAERFQSRNTNISAHKTSLPSNISTKNNDFFTQMFSKR